MSWLAALPDAVVAISLSAIASTALGIILKAGMPWAVRRFSLWLCALLFALSASYFLSIFKEAETVPKLYSATQAITATVAVIVAGAAIWSVSDRRLTQRVIERTQELQGRTELLEYALRDSPITVYSQDTDLKYTFICNPPPGFEPENIMGKADEEILPPSAAEQTIPAKTEVLRHGGVKRFELPINNNGHSRWYDVTVERLNDAAGDVTGTIAVAYDITSRKEHEQRLYALMREVTHRSKNLLAVVHAIARQSADRAENIEDYVMRFSGRLRALGNVHDLLVQREWRGVSLPDLLWLQLVSYTGGNIDTRVTWSGKAVILRSEAAQNLALALHELMTNALRYGALSVTQGRVHVEWTLEAAEASQDFKLTWREINGPPVLPPQARGFGRLMLEKVLGQALNAKVSLDFAPEGVNCAIAIPASHLV